MRYEFPNTKWSISILAPADDSEFVLTLHVENIPVQIWYFSISEIADAMNKLENAAHETKNPHFRDMFLESIEGLKTYANFKEWVDNDEPF